jgi:hypothetical protein
MTSKIEAAEEAYRAKLPIYVRNYGPGKPVSLIEGRAVNERDAEAIGSIRGYQGREALRVPLPEGREAFVLILRTGKARTNDQ